MSAQVIQALEQEISDLMASNKEAIRDAVAAEREACAKVAAMYSINREPIHPDIPVEQMNETAKLVYHTTCQHVAAAIRARSAPADTPPATAKPQ